ncbi:MAG TPA: ATP-grasp domain-containing protein, partial [Baekduia sp.]
IVADRAAMFDAAQSALVLEQYIPDRPGREGERFADYVSVESFVSDGQVNHLAVNGRFPPADPFRETGFFIPSALDEDASAAALAVVDAAVAALGVTVGFLHTEIKMTPDGPCVIEVNGRIGGGVPLMLRDATGIEVMPIAFRLALGETVALDAQPRASRIAYLFLIQAPAAMRRILALDGLDALRADPGVDEVTVNRGPGMEVDRLEGNLGNVFSVTGTVGDHDQLAELFARAMTGVHIGGA